MLIFVVNQIIGIRYGCVPSLIFGSFLYLCTSLVSCPLPNLLFPLLLLRVSTAPTFLFMSSRCSLMNMAVVQLLSLKYAIVTS